MNLKVQSLLREVVAPPAGEARQAPPEETVEHLRLGHVRADFLTREAFLIFCRRWLLSDTFHHVVTLNPEMVMQAESDAAFRQAVLRAELAVPDGAGLIWAQWYIRSDFWSLLPSLMALPFRHLERLAGVEVVSDMAALSQEHQKPLYLLGGTPAQIEKTAARLRREFPRAIIETAPTHTFAYNGPEEIIADIRAKQPAILLVAYGAPKQSIWIEKQREALPSVRIAVGVGGAFAILSDERPRAPYLFRKLNMEWVWRLLLEPTRLPRIWQAVVAFPRLIAAQKEKR